jgi:hypothetical protein
MDKVQMKPLTIFQSIELVLIPITFVFSQVLVLFFGYSIIGNDIWTIIGIPMGFGVIIALGFSIVLIQNKTLTEFSQLEVLLRWLTIIGGIVLIIIIISQIVVLLPEMTIIPLLSLIISIIGNIMTLMCTYFFYKLSFKQNLSK